MRNSTGSESGNSLECLRAWESAGRPCPFSAFVLLRVLSPDVPERTRRRFFSEFPNWLWHPAGSPRWGTRWNVSEPRLDRVAGVPIPEIRDYPTRKLDSVSRFPRFSEWECPKASDRPISAVLMDASPSLKSAVDSAETLRASSKADAFTDADLSESGTVEKMARAVKTASESSKMIESFEKNGFPLLSFPK